MFAANTYYRDAIAGTSPVRGHADIRPPYVETFLRLSAAPRQLRLIRHGPLIYWRCREVMSHYEHDAIRRILAPYYLLQYAAP